MKIIIAPDEGEWALVPKVLSKKMYDALENGIVADNSSEEIYAAMLAAAPPCKVVELPEREEIPMHNCCDIERALGRNEVLDEIERRAK